MSGHSKWATIKRKKGKTDAQRGKIFTKIGREIAVAVRDGGPDPNTNNRLRDVMAKAKANNMPNENVVRSIKKATGEAGSVNYEEITYEGYGAGGLAVIVNVMTDNRNRTAADIRHIFDRWGGSMGATNCVAWMFDRRGVIIIEKSPKIDEDELMMEALEAGAEDFSAEEDVYEVTTEVVNFSAVREALEGKGYALASAELVMIPQTTVSVTDPDALKKIGTMLDLFDDYDDVQEVFHNGDLPEDEDED